MSIEKINKDEINNIWINGSKQEITQLYEFIKQHDDYHEYDNNLRAKLTIYVLGYVPKCECGNDVEFMPKNKTNTKYENEHSTSIGGFRLFCSRDCTRNSQKTKEKSKQTSIKKFGAPTWAQSNQNKSKGVKWDTEKKQKWKETTIASNLKNHGVEWPAQLDSVKEKREQSVLKKTDGKYTNMFQDLERVQAGTMKKHGVKHWKQSKEGKKASQGKNNPLANPETVRKVIHTRMCMKHDEEFTNIILNKEIEKFKDFIHSIVNENNYSFRHEIANHLGLSYSYLNRLFREFGMANEFITLGTSKSYEEEIVYQFISSIYDGKIIRGSRSILGNGQEIDIYIPEFNFGIEYDNLYTHSEYSGGKDNKYHITKTDLAESNGIHLVHILSNEWLIPEKRIIWESIIRNKLNLTNTKIAARKTKVVTINNQESKTFFNNNHLMGYAIGAECTLALLHEDTIVMALSYGKSRTSKDEYELYRVASLIDTNIVGGFGKLFNSIPDEIKNNLITFADRRFSYTNSVYDNYFKEKEKTEPNWWGFQRGTNELMSRWSFTKKNFCKIIEQSNYDDNKTIFDNMIDNGYDRIWDCGNWKFKII